MTAAAQILVFTTAYWWHGWINSMIKQAFGYA